MPPKAGITTISDIKAAITNLIMTGLPVSMGLRGGLDRKLERNSVVESSIHLLTRSLGR
jgi:hypothetical protein